MGKVAEWTFKIGSNVAPFSDELVVQAVELVVGREDLLLPLPLHHRSLHKRGRCIAVELEELWRTLSIIAEVETAIVQSWGLRAPGVYDQGLAPAGNAEAGEEPVLDDIFPGVEEHRVEVVRRILDGLDLGEVEAVAGAFIPIGRPSCRMPDQTQSLDPGLPVRTRRKGEPLHRYSHLMWRLGRQLCFEQSCGTCEPFS